MRLGIILASFLPLVVPAELAPGSAGAAEVPKTWESLWADYDPRHEPLDAKAVREWEEGGIVFRYVTYHIGGFKGVPARMAAFYAFPNGGTRLPGLLHLHGGGQRAFLGEVLYYAKRGYACLSINWGGREMEDARPGEPNTQWGAVDPTQNNVPGYFSLKPGPKQLDPVESPRNNNWYLLTLGARRGLTFLERQPEVDPHRLGVYGFSMGGSLTVYVAGTDRRIKAAVPQVGGSGFSTYPWPLLPEQTKMTPQGDLAVYRATMESESYAPHVEAPLLYLGATNDFNGIMDHTYRTGALIRHGKVRYAFAPHLNHRFTPEMQIAASLWLDQHLKGTFRFPATPESKLILDTGDRVPLLRVVPDGSAPIERVSIYYSLDPEPRARHWRSAEVRQEDNVWSARLPLMSLEQPLFAFANVSYRLDKPEFPMHGPPTRTFAISSLLEKATSKDLKRAGAVATDGPSLVIEDFSHGYRDWYLYSADNPHHWQYWTRKINDPKWRGKQDDRLCFEVRSERPNPLIVVLTENDFRPYRGKQQDFLAVVDLKGGDWQTVTLAAGDFKTADGQQTLRSWDRVDDLGFRAYYDKDGKPRLGSDRWSGSQPTFRRLRWEAASTNRSAAFPLYVLPPTSSSFFTGAPGARSKSASGTQKVARAVAESNITIRFVLSLTVRQMVEETHGSLSRAMPSGRAPACGRRLRGLHYRQRGAWFRARHEPNLENSMKIALLLPILVSFALVDTPARAAEADPVQTVIDQLDKVCRQRPVFFIGPEKAKRLAELVRQKKPEVVVECGTAIGYSGLWIARELKNAGRGKLVTIEIDPANAREAEANFRRAGVEKFVTVKTGDARQVAKELPGPIDFVLLDCGYSNYHPVFIGLEKKLRSGAVVVADNVGLDSRSMGDYLELARSKYRSRTETFEIDLPWAKRDAMEVTLIEPKAPPPGGKRKTPVILDTDIGDDIDDTWALALLLKSPELEPKMVLSDFGDTEYRAKIIAKMLQTAGRTEVAVGVGLRQKTGGGAQSPWVADYDLARYPGKVHRDGVAALIEMILAAPEPITLICIGPMPNIRAALEKCPEIAQKARFIGMHGSVYKGYDGRPKPDAEWNVRADPAACRKAFTAAWPMTITPLDTCGLVRLKGEKYRRVADSQDPIARAVIENYRLWRKAHDRKAPDRAEASSVLFDTAAIYLAVSHDLVAIERLPLRVTDTGFTEIDRQAGKPIDCAVSWKDLGAFEDFLVDRLTK